MAVIATTTYSTTTKLTSTLYPLVTPTKPVRFTSVKNVYYVKYVYRYAVLIVNVLLSIVKCSSALTIYAVNKKTEILQTVIVHSLASKFRFRSQF